MDKPCFPKAPIVLPDVPVESSVEKPKSRRKPRRVRASPSHWVPESMERVHRGCFADATALAPTSKGKKTQNAGKLGSRKRPSSPLAATAATPRITSKAPNLDSVTLATVTAITAPASASRSTTVLQRRVVFEVDWTSVGSGEIVFARLPGAKDFWLRMKLENKVKNIEELWTKSTTELNTYSTKWDRGVRLFSSDGFGEVTANFCLFMVGIHAKHTACMVVPIHNQTFIHIGSGFAKAVCRDATLQPNFSSCFGIELKDDRSYHSTEITSVFAKEALRS